MEGTEVEIPTADTGFTDTDSILPIEQFTDIIDKNVLLEYPRKTDCSVLSEGKQRQQSNSIRGIRPARSRRCREREQHRSYQEGWKGR